MPSRAKPFKGGQHELRRSTRFPFRMTDEKLARYRKHKWYPFWTTLKQGYDYFEVNRVPPTVAVCERRYVVNVVMPANGRINPEGRCPRFQRPAIEPFAPNPAEFQIANERIRCRVQRCAIWPASRRRRMQAVRSPASRAGPQSRAGGRLGVGLQPVIL